MPSTMNMNPMITVTNAPDIDRLAIADIPASVRATGVPESGHMYAYADGRLLGWVLVDGDGGYTPSLALCVNAMVSINERWENAEMARHAIESALWMDGALPLSERGAAYWRQFEAVAS